MKTKYNYNLEIKQFLILYLRVCGLAILIPAVVILMPLIVLFDWLWNKCRYSYWEELYKNYIEFSNMEINLP